MRHLKSTSLALLALTLASVGCVRETVSCADQANPICADVGTDAGAEADVGRVDAPRPDAARDAFSVFDAWAPPPDAYVIPDAGSDGGICSRCPGATPACLGGTSCVQCTAENSTACGGPTPACDLDTNTCVPCTSNANCTVAGARACNVDTNTCVACVDNATCSGGTPVCRTDTNTCVGCLSPTDCPGTLLDACVSNICLGCDDRTDCTDDLGLPACVSNTCRQCDTNTDCGSAAAARCNLGTNTCAGCTADMDCMHLTNTPACNEGTGACVPCMPDNESFCAGNSCNPTTRTCTTTPRLMTRACNRCIADSECAGGLSCTEAVTGGFYCFPNRPGTGCAAPYIVSRPTAATASGAVGDVCRLRAATCEAFLDYPNQSIEGAEQCGIGGSSDAACGAPGVADGSCRRIGDVVTGGFRCTYRCSNVDDCDGTACIDFASDGDSNRYCEI